MRKHLLILLVFVSCQLFLSAQPKEFSSFIPAGYDTLFGGIAKGDLNNDGIKDIAMALYPKWENDDDWNEKSADSNVSKRLLIILFGTKTGYMQAAKSSNTVLCKDCGGIFGDSFAGIEIRKNVLNVYHYGGSSWRWSYTHKFRYQGTDFFLIGQTTSSYWNVKNCDRLDDFAGTKYEDINFITGQYERKEISEDCKLVENKKGKKKIEPLISLAKFEIDN